MVAGIPIEICSWCLFTTQISQNLISGRHSYRDLQLMSVTQISQNLISVSIFSVCGRFIFIFATVRVFLCTDYTVQSANTFKFEVIEDTVKESYSQSMHIHSFWFHLYPTFRWGKEKRVPSKVHWTTKIRLSATLKYLIVAVMARGRRQKMSRWQTTANW